MLRKWLGFLAPLALASCALPAAEPLQDADPAIWVLRDRDTTIYLFGTVHALRPGLGWFDEGVKTAFDKSGELVLELVLPPEAEMTALLRELGTLPPGQKLSDRLPPEVAAKMRDALSRAGQPVDSLEGLEPWLAAIQLAVLPARAVGYDSANGAETVLGAAAKKARKRVSGLETARQQFTYFDKLSPAAQLALLERTLEALPKAGDTLDRIVAAWSTGDTEALAALMNEDLLRSPELMKALLVARNQRWAATIAARMKRPGTVFVAVGAGHLAGQHALQTELAKRGFKVQRVRY